MSTDTQTIFTAALSLPPDHRAALAEKLLDSLTEEEQQAIDSAWGAEAERRLTAYDQGLIQGLPYEEVKKTLLRGSQP